MYCSNCGKHNTEDCKFCQYCGSKIETVHGVESVKEEGRNSEKLQYCGFWIRLGAYFADFIGVILLALVFGVIESLLGMSDVLSKIGILGDYLIWVVYSTFFLSIWSSTPGKMLYGLRVEKDNGDKLDFSTSVIRALLQPLSFIFFGAGFWNMGKNEKQQAWHDKRAETIVVGEKKGNYIIQIIISVIGLILYVYLRSLSTGQ